MSIKRFENFLREDLYEYTFKTARELLSSGESLFSSNRQWNHKIVKDSFPVLIHRIDKNSHFFSLLKENVEKKTKLRINETADIMLYYWTRFSYIPWHNDGNHYAALTIYLNPLWDLDYGGYYLYRTKENEIKAIIPERNLALLQFGGVDHCTTPVNFDGDVRLTLQIFFNREDNTHFDKNEMVGKKKILKFSSSSCNICKHMSEILNQLNLDFEIEEIDVIENESMMKEYDIEGYPTFIMLEDGLEIKRIFGIQTEKQLLNWINN